MGVTARLVQRGSPTGVAWEVVGLILELTVGPHKIRMRETRLLVRAVVQQTAVLVRVAGTPYHSRQLVAEAAMEEMQRVATSLIPREVEVEQEVLERMPPVRRLLARVATVSNST